MKIARIVERSTNFIVHVASPIATPCCPGSDAGLAPRGQCGYPCSPMQQTLILLKPDCVQKRKVGEVVRRFEDAGFRIRGFKMMSLDEAVLREHYAHIADKPFFPEVVRFMQSSPVVAMVLEGDNAVDRVRELLGPTDSTQAAKGTIRGDLGVDKMVNVAHASDSTDAAAAEIQRFFAPGEVVA